MYGFTGYGTNEYGSLRQEKSFIKILAILGVRTVRAFTNFSSTVQAFTNQSALVTAFTNFLSTVRAFTNFKRTVTAENDTRTIPI